MQGVKSTIETFWLNVDKSSNCWEWTGRKDDDGYGLFWFNGKNHRAPRFSLGLVEKLNTELVTRHSCNNPGCVNPDHLSQSTQKMNIHDQLLAGTHSKLRYSDEVVESIRTEYKAGNTSTRKLAAKYGIGKSQVHLIVTGGTRTVARVR